MGMDETKKLFFCGRAGFDNPGAWCKMMSEAEARSMVSESLKKAGVPEGQRIQSYSVDSHPGDGSSDSRFYRWGLDEPSFDGDEHSEHVGTSVEVDGKAVYNDIRPAEDSEEHDPDCDVCAKG